MVSKEPKEVYNGKITVERVEARCPCGEIVQSVSLNGKVEGYCSILKQRVEALIVLHN